MMEPLLRELSHEQLYDWLVSNGIPAQQALLLKEEYVSGSSLLKEYLQLEQYLRGIKVKAGIAPLIVSLVKQRIDTDERRTQTDKALRSAVPNNNNNNNNNNISWFERSLRDELTADVRRELARAGAIAQQSASSVEAAVADIVSKDVSHVRRLCKEQLQRNAASSLLSGVLRVCRAYEEGDAKLTIAQLAATSREALEAAWANDSNALQTAQAWALERLRAVSPTAAKRLEDIFKQASSPQEKAALIMLALSQPDMSPTVQEVEAKKLLAIRTLDKAPQREVTKETTRLSERKRKEFLEAVTLDGRPLFTQLPMIRALAAASECVCCIRDTISTDEQGNARVVATGFSIGHDGWIATNFHVVDVNFRDKLETESGVDWSSVTEENIKPDLMKQWVQDWTKPGRFEFEFGYESPNQTGLQRLKRDETVEPIFMVSLDVVLLKLEKAPSKAGLNIEWDAAEGKKESRKGRRCFVMGHPVSEDGNTDHMVMNMHRDNIVRDCGGVFVTYYTDTREGNSGSPVFVWDEKLLKLSVVAIHHSGRTLDNKYKEKEKYLGFNTGTLMGAVAAWSGRNEKAKKILESIIKK